MLVAVKTYLQKTHRIDCLEQGHTNIFNGGSFVTLLGGIGGVVEPGQYILTPEIHWDGYDGLAKQTKTSLLEMPRGKELESFLHKKLSEKVSEDFSACVKKKIGCILITHPCSITGKTYSDEELGDYLRFSKKYHIPLVVNEVYASPDHTGKPYNSITQNPEYKGAEQLVYISASLSKTFQQLHAGHVKLAMAWTENDKWAATAKELIKANDKPFTNHSIAFNLAVLRATTHDYFIESERQYEKARQLVHSKIEEVNREAGRRILSWSDEGYPTSGYMAAIQLDPAAAAKAGIQSPLDLWEYVYKIGGINTGPVFFAEDTLKDQSPAPMAVRINYSFPAEEVAKGIDGLNLAIHAMDQGITFEQIKSMHGHPRDRYEKELLLEKMLAEFGGSNAEVADKKAARG